jgi:hypothetical protein
MNLPSRADGTHSAAMGSDEDVTPAGRSGGALSPVTPYYEVDRGPWLDP